MSLEQMAQHVKIIYKTKRKARQTHRCKHLHITINLEKVFQDHYAATFKPKLPVALTENCRITFQPQALGRTQPAFRLYVGKIEENLADLDTNLSMHTFIEPVLKGLKIIEPAQ